MFINQTVRRYYNNKNELGFLYSTGYGNGWSTAYDSMSIAYDKRIVEYWLISHPSKKKMETFLEMIGYFDPPMSNYEDLDIIWIPKGKKFHVKNYDGKEFIIVEDDERMIIA